jgi:hypothetical protein
MNVPHGPVVRARNSILLARDRVVSAHRHYERPLVDAMRHTSETDSAAMGSTAALRSDSLHGGGSDDCGKSRAEYHSHSGTAMLACSPLKTTGRPTRRGLHACWRWGGRKTRDGKRRALSGRPPGRGESLVIQIWPITDPDACGPRVECARKKSGVELSMQNPVHTLFLLQEHWKWLHVQYAS